MKGDFPDGSGHSCLDLGSSLVSEVVLTPGRSFRLVTAVKFKIFLFKKHQISMIHPKGWLLNGLNLPVPEAKWT